MGSTDHDGGGAPVASIFAAGASRVRRSVANMIRSLSEAGLNGGVGYERSLSGSFADEHSTAAMGVSSPSSASPTHPNSSHSSSSSPLATMMCKLPFGRLMAGVVFVALSLLTFKHWNTGGLEAFVLVIQNDPYGTMHLFFLAHVVSFWSLRGRMAGWAVAMSPCMKLYHACRKMHACH